MASRTLGWKRQYPSPSNGSAPYRSVFLPPFRLALDFTLRVLFRDLVEPLERNDVLELRLHTDAFSAMSS